VLAAASAALALAVAAPNICRAVVAADDDVVVLSVAEAHAIEADLRLVAAAI